MKLRTIASLIAVLALLAMAIPAAAGPATAPEPMEPDRPAPWELDAPTAEAFASDLWFVEFSEPPAVRGGSPAVQANERAHANVEARQHGVAFDVQRDFGTLWNGVTVRADHAEIAEIRTLTGVTAVYPVALVERPEPQDVSPDLATALAMTGADAVHSELGFTGAGLSVAVIDTGIDYNHPDLGGDGDPANVIEADPDDRSFDHPRISHAWDYVGDDFDASVPDAEPDPDPDPMDPHGHGTHVTGIVGASAADEGGATGVAPDATFGAYKVFGLTGPTTADIIVEALEDAFVDGMDAVNMSIGASLVWGQDYPTTATSNELVEQGVVVVNSAGNDAALGSYSLSAPANAHDIISVASADNTSFDALVFDVAQLDDPIPFTELAGAELPPTEGESEEVVWLGRACVDTEGDELLDDPDGKVALIERGDCTFAEKYLAAADEGATGVVIHNNVAGMFSGTILDAGVEGVWGAGINRADGLTLRELIDDPDETVVLGFTDETESLPNPTGGLVSSFSSYGQDVELAFGPSIMAPGGLITSTWPLDLGGYATISGTSMSAPHVAGAVALLLEAVPDLDPFQVRDRLQNSSEPAMWSLNPGLGFPDHTFRQGAGMVQIDRAIQARQRVTPGQIALGDANVTSTTLTIRNDGDRTVRYSVTHTPALETGVSTFTPDFFLAGAAVDVAGGVTIPSGRTADLQVTITSPNTGIPNHQYGGYIVLTPNRAGAATLRVPYSGFDGDYAGEMGLLGFWNWPLEDPIWSFVEVEPRISEIARDGSLEPVDPNHRFTPHTGDFPVLEAFFGHFPQEMRVTAHHLDSGERFDIIAEDHLPRSPEPDFFWAFVWTGVTLDGDAVPAGTYELEVELLRALGDPANDAHVEHWTSPPLRITVPGGPGPGPPGGGSN